MHDNLKWDSQSNIEFKSLSPMCSQYSIQIYNVQHIRDSCKMEAITQNQTNLLCLQKLEISIIFPAKYQLQSLSATAWTQSYLFAHLVNTVMVGHMTL